MKIVISGHRIQKLECYDHNFIKASIKTILEDKKESYYIRGFSGMASGVDLWFCRACLDLKIPYVACIPFEGQELTMDKESEKERLNLLDWAERKDMCRNSEMLRMADYAIIVWDGNKGGTHNVLQQLIENKIDFSWINPVAKVIWECVK